jgi:hypothetical protein
MRIAFLASGALVACSSSLGFSFEVDAAFEGSVAIGSDAGPDELDARSVIDGSVPDASALLDSSVVDVIDAGSSVDAADARPACDAAPVCIMTMSGQDPTGFACGDLTNGCGTTPGCLITNGGQTACAGAPPGTACVNHVCQACASGTVACGSAGCCATGHACVVPGVGPPSCAP